ncbi:MAG: MBL fold metallo-hydrolase [Bacteroidales bacterium]|nr:MBL fold metallo-hydrolase [Bacteroidales bacterium]
MIHIEKMTFNLFLVNTYFLYDETGECIIIDAACYDIEERHEVRDFLKDNKLKLVRNLNTHCHIDHVLGNDFIANTFQIFPEYHQKSIPLLLTLNELGSSFGFVIDRIPDPARFLDDGETIRWGISELKVLYTPGHAEGSVCFYNASQEFVITGDVLFKDTVGRTDLPSGDFNALMQSIRTKLFTLPPDTVVYPGHGPETTIGYEMENNPFIR